MITRRSYCPECDEETKWWKHMTKGYLCYECGYPNPA